MLYLGCLLFDAILFFTAQRIVTSTERRNGWRCFWSEFDSENFRYDRESWLIPAFPRVVVLCKHFYFCLRVLRRAKDLPATQDLRANAARVSGRETGLLGFEQTTTYLNM